MLKDQNELNILRTIDKNPTINQRFLANELGLSLGKINYCLKELNKKRLIKMSSFTKNNKKLSYVYLLTPKGVLKKTELIFFFLKKKSAEYEELQKEIK